MKYKIKIKLKDGVVIGYCPMAYYNFGEDVSDNYFIYDNNISQNPKHETYWITREHAILKIKLHKERIEEQKSITFIYEEVNL